MEINSSFYRPHRPETYARWAASVPADFRFCVKLPKLITHALKLAGIDEALARFAAEVGPLEQRLGCVLIQLPPSAVFDIALAEGAMARLHGSPQVYYSSYSDEYLAALAEDLRIHAQANRGVWLIFDNTASGSAMANALKLRLC